MRRRDFTWFLAAVAAAQTLPRASRLALAGAETRPLQQTGHFALTTLDGRSVTDASYRGKWLLVFFGYTYCPDVCPTVLTQIGRALDSLGPLAAGVQPIFITLDPARDTAASMSAYLSAFDRRIVGLRGDPGQLRAVAKEYHVYYRTRDLGGGDYAVDHSAFIHVIDPQGRFIKVLGGDLAGHRLAEELKKLIA